MPRRAQKRALPMSSKIYTFDSSYLLSEKGVGYEAGIGYGDGKVRPSPLPPYNTSLFTFTITLVFLPD